MSKAVIGTLAAVNELQARGFPSLQRPCKGLAKEGWPRHQKMAPFRKGADGVVARDSRLAMRLKHLRVSDSFS